MCCSIICITLIFLIFRWLIVIENKVSDVEAIMLLYSDSIKLTREYLDVVEQLHNTPTLYFNAVAEVVRRRIFSQALLIVIKVLEFVSKKLII